MIDVIKKTLLAGVGAAIITKEKVEDALGDYVKQGKVKASDAKIIAEKIAEQGRKEFDELSHTLGEKLGAFVKHSADESAARLAALEERIRALEARLASPPTRSGEP